MDVGVDKSILKPKHNLSSSLKLASSPNLKLAASTSSPNLNQSLSSSLHSNSKPKSMSDLVKNSSVPWPHQPSTKLSKVGSDPALNSPAAEPVFKFNRLVLHNVLVNNVGKCLVEKAHYVPTFYLFLIQCPVKFFCFVLVKKL